MIISANDNSTNTKSLNYIYKYLLILSLVIKTYNYMIYAIIIDISQVYEIISIWVSYVYIFILNIKRIYNNIYNNNCLKIKYLHNNITQNIVKNIFAAYERES